MLNLKTLLMTGTLIGATTAFAQTSGSTGPMTGTTTPAATPNSAGLPTTTPNHSATTPMGRGAMTDTPASGAITNGKTSATGNTGTAGVPSATGLPSATGMPSMDSIRQAQTALNTGGTNSLAVDGYMGYRTREAVRQYQMNNNLPVTGQLDSVTMQSLGVTTDERAPASVPGQ